ncbi:ATP-binding protein [Mycolicibacterium sp.]|uniref:ATP-binding protein n=1 Tax=Mycolicibacterium sp. TaxID=2320850 RepID=UPI001D4385A7|nr:ATP-binding protein [Mycolicibacterium sp.]MCB1265688.1 ATP-binding protein [Mycobacterium sp.]MCB1289415.1 ATP-binding protein [Mycobacterium sp.]MCB9409953.1 ATP-binding protein [Mycolicibacterium sp.]
MAVVTWDLDVTTGRHTLDQIHRALERFWSAHSRIPEMVRLQMEIACTEIGANIVAYASDGRPVRMRMELRCRPDRVHIDFIDDGMPADVDLTAVTMPGEWAEHGRGLAMARAVLDRLSYRRSAVANHWTLVSEGFTREVAPAF